MVGSTLVFALLQSSFPMAKSNAERLLPPIDPPEPGRGQDRLQQRRVVPSDHLPCGAVDQDQVLLCTSGPSERAGDQQSPRPPLASVSHTRGPGAPELGRDGLVPVGLRVEDRKVAPHFGQEVCRRVLWAWEMRPPSQTLVPTCLMALTRPSTIGVLSGFWEGQRQYGLAGKK